MLDFKLSSQIGQKIAAIFPFVSRLQLKVTTLLFFGSFGLIGAIALGWLLENPILIEIFTHLHSLQLSPPSWIEVPSSQHPIGLYLPCLILVSLVFMITKISPSPQKWSRTIVITILVSLMLRYLLWRSLSSLNFSNPVDGVFSLLLFLTELMLLGGMILQLILNLYHKERHQEADFYSQAVISGDYQPSVDILIPTYNEPDFILRKTIIGCQAIDYANQEIYLLDDTQRPEIKQLAKTLGCHYITRPDNHHAKAGNLNHALTQTKGELIAIFDADFIPVRHFLNRTIGFFQNPKMGIVQTCQGFYNEDPIAYNLGLENHLNAEDDFFHRYIQGIRDGVSSVVCAGSSFVIKRQVLESVGGFTTETLSEDYHTGLKILSQGYETIHLNEKLSVGLSPENIPSYLLQKARWGQGTLQTLLFAKANLFNFPNLNLKQKLVNINGLLYWLTMIPQSIIMVMPLLYVFFDLRPLVISSSEIVYFFLPYYLINLLSFHWLNHRSRTTVLSEIYNYVKIFPLVVTIVQTFCNPFGQGFKITPKGLLNKKGNFYWKLALPILILWLMNLITLAKVLIDFDGLENQSINLGLIWSIYNLIILSAVLISLRERPRLSHTKWFSFKENIQLENQWFATTQKLSEEGAMIEVNSANIGDYLIPNQVITLTFLDHHLTLNARITRIEKEASLTRITLAFVSVSLPQYRQLIEMIFCLSHRWKHETTVGEFAILWLLLKVLMRPIVALKSIRA